MRISDLRRRQWFHDPALGLEGQVLRVNRGSVTVRVRRRRAIVIHGEVKGYQRYEKKTVAPGWDIEPGKMPAGRARRQAPLERPPKGS